MCEAIISFGRVASGQTMPVPEPSIAAIAASRETDDASFDARSNSRRRSVVAHLETHSGPTAVAGVAEGLAADAGPPAIG